MTVGELARRIGADECQVRYLTDKLFPGCRRVARFRLLSRSQARAVAAVLRARGVCRKETKV
jgi:hypothetical protein